MNIKFLNPVIAGLIMAISGLANASIITWDSVQNTTDYNDVLNFGDTVEAVNATKVNTGTVTVNGVDFNNSTDLLSKGGYIGALTGSSTGNTAYDSFLNSFDFGNGEDYTSVSIGGGNLIANEEYFIQLWFTDLRLTDRDMYFDDSNGNSIVLNANGDGFGQYVTGSFIATGGTQELGLDPAYFHNSHITGYQVRTQIPEPSTIAIFAIALLALASRKVKKSL